MIRVYDTMRGEKVPFVPQDPRKVMMYVCGPTVYDFAHMGHARTEVSFDVIRRYLEYRGYFVVYVSNITDIDDKIINRAKEEGKDAISLSKFFAEEYVKDMKKLKVKEPNIRPKVSDHIKEIIELINILLEKGYAYEADGNVYFEVRKFKEYGKLSHQTLKDILAGARIEGGEGKRNPEDFALWKKAKEGEVWWDSPWGRGRPGWHIECSAMSMRYLGPTLDIHGGGNDLIFPHHENEIAQSECATGKVFARYWIHTGMLRLKGEKMSKSIGNVLLLRNILNKYPAEVIRFYLINAHYRKPIDYSIENLENAKESLEKILNLREYLKDKAEENGLGGEVNVESYRQKFVESMDDDFNTRKAMVVIFDMISEIYEKNPRGENALSCLNFLDEINEIFDIFPERSTKGIEDSLIELILRVRNELRKMKIYTIADEIRESLRRMGIVVEDTKEGTKWRKGL